MLHVQCALNRRCQELTTRTSSSAVMCGVSLRSAMVSSKLRYQLQTACMAAGQRRRHHHQHVARLVQLVPYVAVQSQANLSRSTRPSLCIASIRCSYSCNLSSHSAASLLLHSAAAMPQPNGRSALLSSGLAGRHDIDGCKGATEGGAQTVGRCTGVSRYPCLFEHLLTQTGRQLAAGING